MNELFSFLTIAQWLAVLRIGIGLWWLKSVLHKPLREFVTGQMTDWTIALAENHPLPGFGRMIKRLVEANASWFPYLILLGESAVAVGLIFGFLTPVSLIVGMFLNLNYLLLAGVRPKDINVNKAYQSEQGQNWNMIIAQFVLLALTVIVGGTWSLDGVFGILFG